MLVHLWRKTCSGDGYRVLLTRVRRMAVETRSVRPRGRRNPPQHASYPYGSHRLLMANLGQQQWALRADHRVLWLVVVAGERMLVGRVLGGAVGSDRRHVTYVYTIVFGPQTIGTPIRR